MEDLREILLDEIALEGLDGITLQALWQRLEKRPGFASECVFQRHFQRHAWKTITYLSHVEFFILPEPRSDLVIFDRYEFVEPESGTIIEQPQKEDIYLFCPVECESTNIRGSCSTFYTRIKKTGVTSLPLEEVEEEFGNRLVMVASQEARRTALGLGPLNPSSILTMHSYALLERIGRSRYLGELTHGTNSLALDIKKLGNRSKKTNGTRTDKMDPKSQFYLRKKLLKLQLIMKQSHRHKSLRGSYNVASLLQLKRFFVERKSKFLKWIEMIVKEVQNSSRNMCSTNEIRQLLDAPAKSMKRLFKSPEFLKYMEVEDVPYRVLYPDATEQQYLTKSRVHEKRMKIIRLKNPSLAFGDIFLDSDDEQGDNEDRMETRPYKHHDLYDGVYSFASACLPAFIAAGPNGLSQTEAGRIFGSTKLDTRSLCRSLERRGCLKSVMHDSGKQRVTRYIAAPFEKTGSLSKEFRQWQKKLSSFKNKEPSETPAMNEGSTIIQNSLVEMKHDMDEPPELSSHVIAELNGTGTRSSSDDEIISQPTTITPSKSKLPHETTRLLKRKTLIVEALRRERVITDRMMLQRMICQKEEMEGCTSRMDRKSLNRIISRLEKENYIRIVTAHFTEPVVASCTAIVDPILEDSSPFVQAAFEHYRHKLLVKSMSKEDKPAGETPEKILPVKHPPTKKSTVDESLEQLRQMQDRLRVDTGTIKPNLLIKSWVGSKFVRLRDLHYLLFYLAYKFDGDVNLDQEEAWKTLKEKQSIENLEENLPKLYHKDLSWKMFIPPLPKHNHMKEEGWVFVVDLLLRLPLCSFVCLVNASIYDEALRPYLVHPVKKYMLVKDLPSEIRTYILQGRRYVASIVELLNKLCYMGLLQYGKHLMKEKDQVFIYINQVAITVDTTTSDPGYHIISDKQYIRTHHSLSNMLEVRKYWMALETICLHTPLGAHAHAQGKNIVVNSLDRHPCLQSRTPEEAVDRDVGYIPGDGLGAGGLDSSLFSHLRRNWCFKSKYQTQDTLNIYSMETTGHEKSFTITKHSLPGPIKSIEVKKIANPKLSLYKPSTAKKMVETVAPPVEEGSLTMMRKAPKPRKKVVNRFVKMRRKPVRKPYYDDTDRAALRLMKKLRVVWSSCEDFLLILCRVASMILLPSRVGQISFVLVRDYLHSRLDISKNKTSRACQRRVNFMLKNRNNTRKFNVYLQGARCDENIMKNVKTFSTNSSKDTPDSELYVAFVDLVDHLVEKFRIKHQRRESLDIPDTLEEFHRDFEFVTSTLRSQKGLLPNAVPPEIQTKEDIDYFTVYTLMFSCFCCLQDKESWGCQLYLVWQQYQPLLLKTILEDIRDTRMTSLKKQPKRKFSKRDLPLTTSPYQLSQTFINLFSQKYQQEVYHLTWNTMKNLITMKQNFVHSHLSVRDLVGGKRKQSKQGFACRKQRKISRYSKEVTSVDSVTDFLRTEDEPKLKIGSNPDGGACATILSLFAIRSIKMEHLIPESIVEAVDGESCQTSNDNIMRRIQDHEKISEQKLFVPENLALEADDDEEQFLTEAEYQDEEETKADSSQSAVKGVKKPARTRMAIFRHREYVLGQSDTPSFTAACQENMKVKLCELSISLAVPPDQLLPEVKLGDLEYLFSPVPKVVVDSCLQDCQKVLLTDKVEMEENSELARCSRPILKFIGESEEMGVTCKMLKDKFGDSLGQPILKYVWELEKLNQILRLGVTTRRWIMPEFSKKWLISTRKIPRHAAKEHEAFRLPGVYHLKDLDDPPVEDSSQTNSTMPCVDEDQSMNSGVEPMDIDDTAPCENGEPTYNADGDSQKAMDRRSSKKFKSDSNYKKDISETLKELEQKDALSANMCSYEEIHVKVRPWVRLNGCINRRVLDQFLGSILFYIQENPGIRTPQIGAKFYPGLLPAHTYELLDILVQLGCVRRYYLSAKSTSKTPFEDDEFTGTVFTEHFDFDDDLIHETTPDFFLKLSAFIGDKKYKGDFLSVCR